MLDWCGTAKKVKPKASYSGVRVEGTKPKMSLAFGERVKTLFRPGRSQLVLYILGRIHGDNAG